MRDRDTELHFGTKAFPSTHWSMVARARNPEDPAYRESLERLVTDYWRPIYVYIRSAWARSNEEAKDSTQEFLCGLMESRGLSEYKREKGRFRAYVKGALRHFLLDREKGRERQKRGGGRTIVSLDVELPEVPRDPSDPAQLFDHAWGRALMEHALEDVRSSLRGEGREICWSVFEAYELPGSDSAESTYRDVAVRFGIRESEVKSHLTYTRLLVKKALRRHAADTVASEGDLYRELRELFET